MTVGAETIRGKTNNSLAGNVCLYDAAGNPISSIAGGGMGVSIVGPSGMVASVIGENSLRTLSQPYSVGIVQGDIAGHTPFYKRGFTPAATTTESTLWAAGTPYVWPVAGQQMRVVSTSAADAPAGTEVLTVHLHYLDSTYAEKDEIITLNGVTPVLTVGTDIFRINSFHANTAGTGGKAAGTISIQNTAGTISYSLLSIGFTVCRCSVYTVPIGKTLYVSDVTFSAAYTTAGKSERMTLHASFDPDGGIPSTTGFLFWPYSEIMIVDNVFVSSGQTILKFAAKTDLKVSVIGETNAVCTSELRGWLE